MGYFSRNCKVCGRSVRPREATNETSRWMTRVVVLTPDGAKLVGRYDGYGRIDGAGANERFNDDESLWDVYENNLEFYHLACHELVGKPEKFTSRSDTARDQGFFTNEDPEQPQTLEECIALRPV